MLLFPSMAASVAQAALPSPADLAGIADATTARDVFKAPGGPAVDPYAGAAPPSDTTPMGWDIEHYTLAVRIDPAAHVVTGLATISATRTSGGDLVLDARGPVIGAVRVDGVAVTPTVGADDELHIAGLTAAAVTVEVEWTFAGQEPVGLQWGRDVVYAFHEPSGARVWLPVYDHPWDKATLDWYVTAPDGWVVAANGVLDGPVPADAGWSTWHYELDAPIATYLMTVALSDYTVLVSGDEIPVYAWVYPGREADADATFGTTADMLTTFSALYAPYPWPSYGNAMTPFVGAMEDTTCTSFADTLVGSDDGELVNVHELGHHWFGDDVTLATWADIWLNEGFATYTEALWYEQAYGQEGLTEYADYLTRSYIGWREYEGQFPVYDPLYLWGGTVYDKGGLVLHMLRGVLGDDAFFAALGDYEAAYHFGNATTDDFEASVEASTGLDLAWFFDEWIYGVGEPAYTWGWTARSDGGDGWQLDLSIAQDLPDFRMPVPIRVTFADGTTTDIPVTVTGARTGTSLCLDAEPVGVELDPDLWVLRGGEVEEAGVARAAACGPAAEADPEAGCGCVVVPAAGPGAAHLRGLGAALGVLGSLAWARRRGGA
jgi:aminopeptidase N